MNEQEFQSDSEQSDEDYCPDRENSDNPSEIESDDNLDDVETITESSDRKKSAKQRKKQKSTAKNIKKRTVEKNEIIEDEPPVTDEDDKAKADALWADFLVGTDPLPIKKSETKKIETKVSEVLVEPKLESKKIVTEIFDFAGEKVAVTKELNEPKTSVKSEINMKSSGSSNGIGSRLPIGGFKRSGGGIGSVLGQLAKKSKINVLDKSKLDWDKFKRNAGIDEDLQTFNKGKDGYLERQDFLERTDVRQFELEKNIRLSRKNKRNC